MGSVAEEASPPWPFARVTIVGRLQLRQWLPLVLVLLGAIATRHLVGANSDVSWLITAAEKMLDGRRLYVDILETNPPASILLYIPPVAFAHAVGIRPELIVDGFVFLAAATAMWLAGRILMRAHLLDDIDRGSLAASVALILTIVPAETFGDREQIVVIGLLPALAVLSVRAKGLSPTLASIIASGIGAGMAMVIKPYFVLAVGPAIVAAALCAKSWRTPLAAENWIAGALVVAYGAVVVLAWPQFISDFMPVVNDVYVPVRVSWWTLLVDCPAVLLWGATLSTLALMKPQALLAPALRALLVASAGFGIAFLLQGKGWPYHSYPMLALALIALAAVAAGRREATPLHGATVQRRIVRLALISVFILIIAATFRWMNLMTNPRMDLATAPGGLIETIRRINAKPTMVVISFDISVGHPLVRQVGGKWVASAPCLWMSLGAIKRRRRENLDADTIDRLNGYEARDRATLAEDIRRARPDIIVVDNQDASRWIASADLDPTLPELLKGYREVDTIGDFLILRAADQHRDATQQPM